MNVWPDERFETPVALSVYSRPHFVRRLVAALRPVRPRHLLIFADAPNPERSGDDVRCQDARAVIGEIDWPCDVEWDVSASNLGPRKRIQSGLAWVFERVDEVIFFEEDCIPDPTFLLFCRELLARYRDDPRVLIVSGMAGRTPKVPFGPESYEFSINPDLYGWAAWRRTWAIYDANVDSWPALRPTNWLRQILGDRHEARLWEKRFDLVREGLDTWDHSLVFSVWKARGLSIRPRHDLVENIGFGPDGTHTLDTHSAIAQRRARPIAFPLVHPKQVDDWRVARDSGRRARKAGGTWPAAIAHRRDAIRRMVASGFGPASRSGRLRRIFRTRSDAQLERCPTAGTPLDFADARLASPPLLSGWSFPEKGGRWSIGLQASVIWRRDRDVGDDLLCRIRATPALHPSQPGMRVDVFVNDRLCATSLYGSNQSNGVSSTPCDPIDEFRIPRMLLNQRPAMVMTFFVRFPLVPAEHDISDDFRALGLFVRSIGFEVA